MMTTTTTAGDDATGATGAGANHDERRSTVDYHLGSRSASTTKSCGGSGTIARKLASVFSTRSAMRGGCARGGLDRTLFSTVGWTHHHAKPRCCYALHASLARASTTRRCFSQLSGKRPRRAPCLHTHGREQCAMLLLRRSFSTGVVEAARVVDSRITHASERLSAPVK